MPKSPESYNLEDISFVEFRKLLPDAWVCRHISNDYGVDLEVEIFDEEGNSTDLAFNVRIKAIDNVIKKHTAQMKMARLKYLSSLDAPSMLVHYCDATKSTHFKWITNIIDQIQDFSADSTTITFDVGDAWNSETSLRLLQTVKIYRMLKSGSMLLPLGLTIDDEGQSKGTKVLELKLAVSKLQSMSDMIVSSDKQNQCLPIVLRIHGEIITASIDVVTCVSLKVDNFTSDVILSELTYVLAYMTGRFDFQPQTDDLIRVIQANKFNTRSRLLASKVAQSAIGSLEISAEISHRNGLHSVQDLASLEYLDALLSYENSTDKRKSVIEKYFNDSIVAQDPEKKDKLSTIYNSLANYQIQIGCYAQAVTIYNLARKLNRAYLERPYFLNGFATCCFFRGRFKVAARLYAKSYEMVPDTQIGICAGDAMLYSGDFTGAKEVFVNLCEESADHFVFAEIEIKTWLSSWLDEFYHLNELSGTAILNSRAFWFNVIDQALKFRDYNSALGAALMEGFFRDGDEMLWADAMNFALMIGDGRLMAHTFSCAIVRNGYEVYTLFRKKLEKDQFPSDGLARFDQLASEVDEMRPARRPNAVTIRLGGSTADQVQFLP